MPRAEIGSPEWLRAVPRRWGLRQHEACRVMGIARRTFLAKCKGTRPITERLVAQIVNAEMVLADGLPPFGWPAHKPIPRDIEISYRTLDHLMNVIASHPPLLDRALNILASQTADSVLESAEIIGISRAVCAPYTGPPGIPPRYG